MHRLIKHLIVIARCDVHELEEATKTHEMLDPSSSTRWCHAAGNDNCFDVSRLYLLPQTCHTCGRSVCDALQHTLRVPPVLSRSALRLLQPKASPDDDLFDVQLIILVDDFINDCVHYVWKRGTQVATAILNEHMALAHHRLRRWTWTLDV